MGTFLTSFLTLSNLLLISMAVGEHSDKNNKLMWFFGSHDDITSLDDKEVEVLGSRVESYPKHSKLSWLLGPKVMLDKPFTKQLQIQESITEERDSSADKGLDFQK